MKILDFPELRQAYEYDCGANALQSVLVYFGVELNEETIIKEAKTSKKGTSVLDIKKTAEKHGLKTDSREMNVSDLKSYIDKKIPVIVLLQAWNKAGKNNWEKRWNDGHYVAAIGYDEEKIYFEDPYAFRRTFLTFKDLPKRWHGVVRNKKHINYGIAIYGKVPKFSSQKIIHMG